MRSYELMYILDPTLDEDGSTALVGKIEELMTKQGVEIENTEPWGKRRLAYRVKGHWEGNYVLSNLKATPEVIPEVERRLRNTDGVLRFLTVRIDEERAKAERRKARHDVKEAARRDRKVQKNAQKASEAPSPSLSPSLSPSPPPAPALAPSSSPSPSSEVPASPAAPPASSSAENANGAEEN